MKNKNISKVLLVLILLIGILAIMIIYRNTTNYQAEQNKINLIGYTIQLEEDFNISILKTQKTFSDNIKNFKSENVIFKKYNK